MKLMIIWGSSRQGRRGGVVAGWVKQRAEADQRFEVDFVDLRELNLPFFDEPISPFTIRDENKQYTHPEGEAWAQRVAKADGYIIISPEYNHGYTGVLKNALDWVGREWVDKPVSFVSYGSASGGARAVEQLRTVTIELGMIQVANPIHFVFYRQSFESGQEPSERSNQALTKMFNELERLHKIFTASKV